MLYKHRILTIEMNQLPHQKNFHSLLWLLLAVFGPSLHGQANFEKPLASPLTEEVSPVFGADAEEGGQTNLEEPSPLTGEVAADTEEGEQANLEELFPLTGEIAPAEGADAEEEEQANLEEPLTGDVLPALGDDAEEGGHLPLSSRRFPGYEDLSRAI